MSNKKSGLERAKSEFLLVEPVGGSDQVWDAYTAERNAVKDKFSIAQLEGNDGDDESGDWVNF
jgi:hypothetical protein